MSGAEQSGAGTPARGSQAVPCRTEPARTHPCALREVVPAERVVQIEAHHVAVSQGELLLHCRTDTAAKGRRTEEDEEGARAVLPAAPGGAFGAPSPPVSRPGGAALTCAGLGAAHRSVSGAREEHRRQPTPSRACGVSLAAEPWAVERGLGGASAGPLAGGVFQRSHLTAAFPAEALCAAGRSAALRGSLPGVQVLW